MATEKQILVLKALRFNDFGAFNGAKVLPDGYVFDKQDWAVWSECIGDCGLANVPTGKALSGVVSTLTQAGLAWSDGECVGLTKAGFDLVETTGA